MSLSFLQYKWRKYNWPHQRTEASEYHTLDEKSKNSIYIINKNLFNFRFLLFNIYFANFIFSNQTVINVAKARQQYPVKAPGEILLASLNYRHSYSSQNEHWPVLRFHYIWAKVQEKHVLLVTLVSPLWMMFLRMWWTFKWDNHMCMCTFTFPVYFSCFLSAQYEFWLTHILII